MGSNLNFTKFKALELLIPKGFQPKDQILLSGTPGTGKTLLALQFISEGAKMGERGVYVSFESDVEYLISQGRRLGLELAEQVKQKKLVLLKLDPSDLYAALDELSEIVEKLGAKRIVIDSVSIASVYASSYRNLPEDLIEFLKQTKFSPPISIGDNVRKQMVYHLLKKIRDLNCTTILISELPKNSEWYSRDTISEFVCDGIILLDQQILGEQNALRTIAIVKMRGSDYKEGVYEFVIQRGKGTVVKASVS